MQDTSICVTRSSGTSTVGMHTTRPKRNAEAEYQQGPRSVWQAEPSVRERLRQPEPAEDAAVEVGHGRDPLAGEGEDEEARSVTDAARAGAKVGSERRLAIGPRRHE